VTLQDHLKGVHGLTIGDRFVGAYVLDKEHYVYTAQGSVFRVSSKKNNPDHLVLTQVIIELKEIDHGES
jgi:hypothetical protein